MACGVQLFHLRNLTFIANYSCQNNFSRVINFRGFGHTRNFFNYEYFPYALVKPKLEYASIVWSPWRNHACKSKTKLAGISKMFLHKVVSLMVFLKMLRINKNASYILTELKKSLNSVVQMLVQFTA